MSHRSQVTTQIANLGFLQQALQKLNIPYYEGQELTGSYTSDWSSADKAADLVLEVNGSRDVGFKKNSEGYYDMVGDFYKKDHKSIQQKIEQQYNIAYTLDLIGSTTGHGITGYELTTLENGDIELNATVEIDQIVNS